MNMLNENRDPRVRSFVLFIILTIITFGIYYLYWLYINLKEIREALFTYPQEKVVGYARIYFGIYAATIIIFVLIVSGLSLSRSPDIQRIISFSINFSILITVLGGIFFYYFTAMVAAGQIKTQLNPFNFFGIYGLYIGYLIFEILELIFFISGDMYSSFENYQQAIPQEALQDISLIGLSSLFSLIGIIFILFYLYRIQKEINRIWLEGKY